ncbi:MAG: type II toxin-antitoxin system HicB family antitoxin [Candidatus Electrothrix sp. Rat3]|nr:type II toxin-antitoxin system HicB family antitoxin [Candidatus Electrothrix rattekaaiensis]
MNAMTYKGYAASIEYNENDGCFVGHITGIRDRVGFHGESVAELKAAFQEAVEDYLETCAVVGKKPQKPYSGKLTLRIQPELHAAIATAAQVNGQNIQQWISRTLAHASRI